MHRRWAGNTLICSTCSKRNSRGPRSFSKIRARHVCCHRSGRSAAICTARMTVSSSVFRTAWASAWLSTASWFEGVTIRQANLGTCRSASTARSVRAVRTAAGKPTFPIRRRCHDISAAMSVAVIRNRWKRQILQSRTSSRGPGRQRQQSD